MLESQQHCYCLVKSLAEKKKKSQEDVSRLETELEQLRSSHDVSS